MDEPQLTNEPENIDVNTEKSDLNEVLDSAFEANEAEKPMEVDDVNPIDEPGTSAESDIQEPTIEDVKIPESIADPIDQEAGEDVSLPEVTEDLPNETVEQVIFEKASEIDETIASEADQLDFTERSVNFSQLNVEHNDDSNDAFNALKESETDALQTPKEEVDEPKETETEENREDPVSNEPLTIDDNDDSSEVIHVEPSVEPMETEPSEAIETVDKEIDASPIEETAKDQDEEKSVDNDVEPSEPVEIEESEDTVEDDVTTETTNEGEGIDEDVCLLGDEPESVENEADKESDAIDVDDVEATSDKDVSTSHEKSVDSESDPKPTEEPEESADIEVVEEDIESQPMKKNEIREICGLLPDASCLNCENSTQCMYKVLEESDEIKHLCTYNCVKEHRDDNQDKYSLTQKKVIIDEITEEEEQTCLKCNESKQCKYRFNIKMYKSVTKEAPAPAEGEEPSEEIPSETTETVESTEMRYLCEEETCLKDFVADNSEKYVVKAAKKVPEEVAEPEQEIPKFVARSDLEVEAARLDRDQSFVRRCAQCFDLLNLTTKSFSWETLDFCNGKCLGQYQNLIGATCNQCNQVVSLVSIGKLCVKFGAEAKQFCTSQCLNDFKKGYQPCSLCFKNLKNDPDDVVPTKRGKSFCDDTCAKTYDEIVNPRKNRSPYLCSVCNNKKSPEVVASLDGNIHRFCSNPCFSAFKFVNNVVPDQCDMCTKCFERKSSEAFTIFQGETPKIFCTQNCMNLYTTKNREILKCNWCKVSKYNYDILQTNNGKTNMCSLNCLSLYEVSLNAVTKKNANCDHCLLDKQPQYHLTMSDASIRRFCTYQCVLGFQSQFSKSRASGDMPSVVPAGTAKRIAPARAIVSAAKQTVPVISRVQSLNTRRGSRKPYNPITNRSNSPIPVPELTVQLERLSDLPARVKVSSLSSLTGGPSGWTPISTSRGSSPVRVEHKTQVVTIPPLPKQVGNKSTMCKAITLNKAINCVPTTAEAECQTEDWLEQRIIVPVPIPVYVPQPMMMYSLPTPVAVPFVLPVPVPVFVPTTRNSASGIMKEIKKIQEKMPTDPYEAELLMMAEMVAGDKKREETDSDSDENNDIEYGDGIENNSSFNEDLVQMAFKMAGNDFDDPPVDLENEMTANTISQSSNAYGDDMDPHSLQHHQLLLLQQQRDVALMQSNRGRKRMPPQPVVKPTNNRNNAPNKRIKREMEVMQPEMPREPAEKPDANMCLKYTFGVNAWKQWVATKNADFEKSSIRRKPIKSEILQLTADELNYSLCMFVKEVRKPNGSEYAPDTIYYLVLGIQQYLYENGRIDNIFTDRYYEQFTDCLDEVAKKFSVLYNDSQYIVTRVEEEHLWECKQLGAHSPHVLLSTLMFFNTKHFNLVTVDEHMELSFSHIMKHWKRNPNQPGAAKLPGSRNVLLRFYPPQSSLEANSRKKKVYEQQENEENPLRCPVKLYEFYLSKCPESVKTRNDVFYLQPERSCVPDSPVWYSTQPLSRDALSKMLHRVKMVKEINIALLTS